MTTCLFHQAVVAVTADLRVRFRHPLACGAGAVVRAWVEDNRRDLWVVKAEVSQARQVKAAGTGRFLRSTDVGREPPMPVTWRA